MNNGTTDVLPGERNSGLPTRNAKPALNHDELTHLKQELMRAEVRLAKARATVVSTEIDIKVLNGRLRALAQ